MLDPTGTPAIRTRTVIIRPALARWALLSLATLLIRAAMTVEASAQSYYALEVRHTNKCLDVDGTANGGRAQQWTCHGGVNQQWQLIPRADGSYKIVSGTGKVLEIDAAGGIHNGAQVRQWQDSGSDLQQWHIVALGNGYYKILGRRYGKALDINGAGDGGRAQQWDYMGGYNQQWLIKGASPPVSTPYNVSAPWAVPGVIEAENFDNGGETVSYHDVDATNHGVPHGGGYRPTGVDVLADAAASNGYAVGWIAAGEWLEYTVNVQTAGTYTFEARVGTHGDGARIHVEFDGLDETGSITLPNTGGTHSYGVVRVPGLHLSAGQHIMRVSLDSLAGAVVDFDSFKFIAQPASTSYKGTPWAVPGTIQAEDFDNGGEGIAYHDFDAANHGVPHGGGYRPDQGVDIFKDDQQFPVIGWAESGEWLKYTINVPSRNRYMVEVLLAQASTGATGTFHIEVDNVDKTGPLAIHNTGQWAHRQTVAAVFEMTAGQHVMRIVLDTEGSGGLVADLDRIKVSLYGPPDVGSSAAGNIGQWSGPIPWPRVGVHMSVLPNGKVLFWPRRAADSRLLCGGQPCNIQNCLPDMNCNNRPYDIGGNDAFVWAPPPITADPSSGTFSSVPLRDNRTPNPPDLFCTGHSFLPDGRLLATGGHIHDYKGLRYAYTFDSATNTWSRAADMRGGRWYPTNVTLANGEVLVYSGRSEDGRAINDLPEAYDPVTNTWRPLSGVQASGFGPALYPWMHLAPNGKVFVSGPGSTGYMDTVGAGYFSFLAYSKYGYRGDFNGSSVMYDPGKVLILGGGATNTAEIIDLTAPTPEWTFVEHMAYWRRHGTATLLPDGKVLVAGGHPDHPTLPAEVWDPATRRWATMASMRESRAYHSTAVLLPDGRVLVAGGGRSGFGDGQNNPIEVNGHFNAELFSPPYLFKGARPTISSAPPSVGYGQTFFVSTPNAASIAKVRWVRLSSVTHSFDMNQRINTLNIASRVSDGLHVIAPAEPNSCPPGHYMLFILNGNGVPSVAKIVRIG